MCGTSYCSTSNHEAAEQGEGGQKEWADGYCDSLGDSKNRMESCLPLPTTSLQAAR